MRWILKELSPESLSVRTPPANTGSDFDYLVEHEFEKKIPACYLIELKNAKVASDGVVFDEKFNVDAATFSSNQTIANRNFLFRYQFHANSFFTRIRSKTKRLSGSYLWATDLFCTNYFHWFADVLPRLIVLPDKYRSLTLLLPNSLAGIAYVKKTLDMLDIPYDFLEPNTVSHVDELIFASHTAPTGNYNDELIRRVGELVLAHEDTSFSLGENIYVSRSKARKRKIHNERELLPVLREYGFAIVNFEDFSWTQQVGMLKNAKCVMGIHGAGLTNMLFMKTGKVLEIRNTKNRVTNCYFSLASALDHTYFIVPALPTLSLIDKSSPNLVISPKLIEEILKQAMSADNGYEKPTPS